MQRPSNQLKIRIYQNDKLNRNSNATRNVGKNEVKSLPKDRKDPVTVNLQEPSLQKIQTLKVRMPFNMPQEPYIFLEESDFATNLSDWLVEVVQYTQFTCQKKALSEMLSQQDIKSYFCKLILEHIKALGENMKDLKIESRYDILGYVDKCLKQILKEHLPRFGKTEFSALNTLKELKSEMMEQSDQFDFLYSRDINFEYNKSQNYNSLIMKTINAIVDVQQEFTSDFAENYAESFRKVCESISLAYPKQHRIIESKVSKRSPNEDQEQKKKKLQLRKLPRFSSKAEDLRTEKTNSPNSSSFMFKPGQKSAYSDVQDKIVQFTQKEISSQFSLKFNYHFKKFGEQELLLGDFACHNTSIYRILKKWVSELQNLVFRTEQTVNRRMNKFKTNSGKLIYLQSYEKKVLGKYISQERSKMEKKVQTLKVQYRVILSKLIQERSYGRFVKNQANLGVFCSKIQESVGQYLLKYLNRLIHTLLLASLRAANAPAQFFPEHLTTEQRNQSKQKLKMINLVSLKIEDSFTGNFKCSETTFPKIIKEILKLNRENAIKIVNIRDKQHQSESHLILNILLQNKVESQLQLCIVKQSELRQNMSHSLFTIINQMIESYFGPISELSTLIAQYDPIVKNYCEYKEKALLLKGSNLTFVKKENADMKILMKSKGVKISLDKPFICDECNQLRIVTNPKMFDRSLDWDLLVCNQCKIKGIRESKLLSTSYFVSVTAQNSPQIKQYKQKIEFLNLVNLKQIQLNDLPKEGFYIELYNKIPVIKPLKLIKQPRSQEVYLITLNKENKAEAFMQINSKTNLAQQLDHILIYEVDKSIFGWADDSGFVPYLESLLKKLNSIQKEALSSALKLKEMLQSLKKKQKLLFLNGNVGLTQEVAKHVGQIQADSTVGLELYLREGADESNLAKYQRRNKQFAKLASEAENLQLQDCGVQKMFSFFNMFYQLTELNLTNNKIKDIENVQEMISLTKVILDRNQIQNFSALSTIKSLKFISINNNLLSEIPSASEWWNLETLYLRNNKIASMKGLQLIPNLVELDLSQNTISKIQFLTESTSLKLLKLKKNKISLIQGLDNLALEELVLSQNNISEFKGLSILRDLNVLDLSYNSISKLTDLDGLIELKELYLSHNAVNTIENLSRLKKLKILKLSRNKLQNLKEINNLSQLTDLDLSQNEVTQAGNIEELKNYKLNTFSLAKNHLKNCPNFAGLHQLEKIDLSFNEISKIQGFQGLSQLCELDLSHNSINQITNLNKLSNLQSLNLSFNDIEEITGLEHLQRLEMLNFGSCQIKELKGLNYLSELQTLLVNNNQLKRISGLDKLISLKNLNLSNNQISDCEGLKMLTKVEILFLNFNNLKQINLPPSLEQLSVFKASSNYIEKLPDFSVFQKLKKIFLQRNELKSINIDNLMTMKSLECINLQENHFTQNIALYRHMLGSKILIN